MLQDLINRNKKQPIQKISKNKQTDLLVGIYSHANSSGIWHRVLNGCFTAGCSLSSHRRLEAE